MYKIKKFMAGLLALCLTLIWLPGTTMAAGGTIRFSDPSGDVGSSVNVSVRVSSSNGAIGNAKITLQYDPSALEFKGGGNATGGSGGVRLVGYGDGSTKMLNYSLSFKILKAGTHKISVSSCDAVNADEEALNLTSGSASVTGKSTGNDDNQSDESKDDNGEDDKRSDNTSLSSLQISPGKLSPQFSPDVTSYKATVDKDVKEIAISAVPESKSANTSVDGATDLKEGSNQVSVTVTAENGASTTYIILVNRGGKKEENEAKPMDGLKLNMGGKVMEFSADFKADMIPKGFEKTTLTYNDQQVLGLKASKGEMLLGYLIDQESGKGHFYICNTSMTEFYPFVQIMTGNNKFVIPMPLNEDWHSPEGFQPSELDLDEQKLNVYQAQEEDEKEIGQVGFLEPMIVCAEGEQDGKTVAKSDFYLLYAMNEQGENNWYLYDSKEKTVQRYMEEVNTDGNTDKKVSDKKETKEGSLPGPLNKLMNMSKSTLAKTLIGAVASVVVLLIILLIVILKRNKDDYDFEEDDDYEDDIIEPVRKKKQAKEAFAEQDIPDADLERDMNAMSAKASMEQEPDKKAGEPVPEQAKPKQEKPSQDKQGQVKPGREKPARQPVKQAKDDFEMDFIDLDDE